MEPIRPMGSLIGFDDHPAAGALNRGRRSTDPGNARFAEVFDLAAYAASGDRDVARVTDARPTSPLTQVSPAANARSLTVASPAVAVADPAVEAAADRLFLHLTTGWTPDAVGTTRAPVVMRLQDASGTELASRLVPAHHDDGPEVA